MELEELKEIIEEAERLLDEKNFFAIKLLLQEMEPADIALVLDEFPDKKIGILFRVLPKDIAAETFVEMETENQELLLSSFTDSEIKEILDELSAQLGIDPEECTEDGTFSLTACRCIGACGLAPVLTVNEDVYGKITAADIKGILAKYAE